MLPPLADAGHSLTYPHEGFWKSMDTSKDQQEMETITQWQHSPWMMFDGVGACGGRASTSPERLQMAATFWKSRNVLVTGGTGLVGQWLVPALVRRGAAVGAARAIACPDTMFPAEGLACRDVCGAGYRRPVTCCDALIEEHDQYDLPSGGQPLRRANANRSTRLAPM